MTPPEARTAYLQLLRLETEIEQAAATALQAWLDIAVAATLPGLTAATEEPEEEEGVPPDVAALLAAAVAWETIVDRDLLPRIDTAMIRAAGAYAERLTGWRTRHLAAVRDRLLSPPQIAADRLTAAMEEERQAGGRVGRMRARARDILSWGRGQWQGWAERVGRTEAAPAAAGTTLAVAEVIAASERADGEPVIDRRKIWWSMRDDRVRATHRHAHGQSQRLADPFLVGGISMQMPGDTSAPPEETYGCRCVLLIDTGAQVASATPVGGTGMRTFRANIIPLGEFGRTQGWMLGNTVELVDTVLPQALKWQKTADPEHTGAYTVAAIESLTVEDGWLVGHGTWLDTPEAAEAAAEVEAGVTRPSVELVGRTEVMTNAAGDPIPLETAEALAMDGQKVGFRIDVAEVVATTLVSVPEFRAASISFADAEPDHAAPNLALVASSTFVEGTYDLSLFDDPLLDKPTKVHVTDDGRVVGHIAQWGVCHVGYKDRCVEAPHSKTGYAYFHQSSVKLTDGDRLAVGRLTVGGGHAVPGRGVAAATEHYDNVATCWAKVRAGEDEHGIWVAGILDPDASPEMIRKALGTPHSGHWEPIGGNSEMIAACCVNSPGYPITQRARNSRGELAMVASFAPVDEVDTSILDDVAVRAVRAYVEEQAAQERAGRARELLAAAGGRRRVLADAIRESHARRKAS